MPANRYLLMSISALSAPTKLIELTEDDDVGVAGRWCSALVGRCGCYRSMAFDELKSTRLSGRLMISSLNQANEYINLPAHSPTRRVLILFDSLPVGSCNPFITHERQKKNSEFICQM